MSKTEWRWAGRLLRVLRVVYEAISVSVGFPDDLERAWAWLLRKVILPVVIGVATFVGSIQEGVSLPEWASHVLGAVAVAAAVFALLACVIGGVGWHKLRRSRPVEDQLLTTDVPERSTPPAHSPDVVDDECDRNAAIEFLEQTPLVSLLKAQRERQKLMSGQTFRKHTTDAEMRQIAARKAMRDFDDQHPERAAIGRYSRNELERWAEQQAYRES